MTDETHGWERDVASFWEGFSDDDPEASVARMDALATRCPVADGRADFERASVRDSVGMEHEASAYYEAAINRGLDAERHGQALVQWASTLRNLGQVERAIELLSQADGASLGGAPKAFLALALSDAGREKEALRTALEVLIPYLPRYQRSLSAYARALTDRAAEDAGE